MGLPPAQFYELTYCELVLMLDGYKDRIKHEARRLHEEMAWIGHLILLPHTPKDEKPVTPAQLLESPKSKRKKARVFTTPIAAFDAFFAAQFKQEVKSNGQ